MSVSIDNLMKIPDKKDLIIPYRNDFLFFEVSIKQLERFTIYSRGYIVYYRNIAREYISEYLRLIGYHHIKCLIKRQCLYLKFFNLT
jgi:hypothetical protein